MISTKLGKRSRKRVKKFRRKAQKKVTACLERALLNTCSELCCDTRKTECSWIVDSGATSQMVQSPDFFKKIDPSEKGFVSFADETKAAIEGKGSGAIKCSIVDKKF